MLPLYMRKAAAALFAEPPTATAQDALNSFLKVRRQVCYSSVLIMAKNSMNFWLCLEFHLELTLKKK